MKHSLPLIITLVALFFITQLVGLFALTFYIDINSTASTGATKIYRERYIVEPPTTDDTFSFAYIMIGILLGTMLAFLILRFRKLVLWKLWFFLSVVICLTFGLLPYLTILFSAIGIVNGELITLFTVVVAAVLAIWKLKRPDIIIHNLTEIFVYTGIAALLVPVLNMFSAILLLILVSIYDMWAVWKTKHMIKLARFQALSNTFAGLRIPYSSFKLMPSDISYDDNKLEKANRGTAKQAILGGGDLAFPLLFAGVILKYTGSFSDALLIASFSSLALFVLFVAAKKQSFYPAMPFLSIGCLLGWVISWWF